MKTENLNEYLKNYDADKYKHPSVTTDTLVFSINDKNEFCVLLTKRTEMPFENYWAIPGGFVDINESLEDNVKRKLKEKINLDEIKAEQLYTFGKVDRDPRTRVISVVYFSLIPSNTKMELSKNAKWFNVNELENLDIAFDHKEIIDLAVHRIRGKIEYSDLAFNLLNDMSRFTIYELQKIHEAILNKKLDTANFRRMFNYRYLEENKVERTGEKCKAFSKRPSDYYRVVPNGSIASIVRKD